MPSWGGASPLSCAFPDSSLWLSLRYGGHVVPFLFSLGPHSPGRRRSEQTVGPISQARMLSSCEVRCALAAQRGAVSPPLRWGL